MLKTAWASDPLYWVLYPGEVSWEILKMFLKIYCINGTFPAVEQELFRAATCPSRLVGVTCAAATSLSDLSGNIWGRGGQLLPTRIFLESVL